MTKHPDLFAALAAPFQPHEVKILPKGGNHKYITARTAMNRLDNVLGPENWWDEFKPAESSVLCVLTIRLPDGSTLTKADAGGYAGMADSGDDDKSGYSDAFKRACVKFGIARYLYRDGVPAFDGEEPAPTPRATTSTPEPPAKAAPSPTPSHQASFDNFKIPRPGKQVYAWAKAMESHYKTSFVDGMRSDGQNFGFGTDFTTWDKNQVDAVCGNAIQYIRTLPNYKNEFGAAPAAAPSAADQGAMKITKQLIVDTVKAILKQTHHREPTAQEVRDQIGELSAATENGQGFKGESVGTLSACTDAAWLTNMSKNALAYLKQISAPAGAAAAAADAVEDDNPF